MPDDQSNNPTRHVIVPGAGEVCRGSRLADSVLAKLCGTVDGQAPGCGWQPPSPEAVQGSFPQYEIRGILGRGGMGAVYKAWHKNLQRFVAIKILPHRGDDGGLDFAGRFKQEARAMAKLRHPGIIAVYDAGETRDGLFYFVMEYIEGTDVERLVVERGTLPAAQALEIAGRLCAALAYAHGHGVIHRDIKPSNVLIEADGSVKVADFGLAKFITQESEMHTKGNVSIGTPDFMPPEALSDPCHVDHRADLYAAGGMLYQMLTGKVPHGRFEPPSALIPGLDKRIDGIVDKAMQPDPRRRYASAAEMLADLSCIASTLEQPADGRTGTSCEPHRGSRAKLVMFGLLGVFLLGIAAVAIGPLGRNSPKAHSDNDTRPAGDVTRATPVPALPEPHAPQWNDAFAEFPLKEVIAKSERTPRGYRLPDTNHWPVSQQRYRAGAVRIRATSSGAQFPSLFVSLEDSSRERIRFRDLDQKWILSLREPGVNETDFATAIGSSPLDGQPHELLLARIGGRLRAMLDGRLLLDEADPTSVPGRFVLDIFHRTEVWVEKVEYLNLENVSEGEALRLIGLDAGSKQKSPAPTAGGPTAEPWVDLLRPEAAAMLHLDGVEQPGPEGLVVPENGKATVAGPGGLRASDGALRFRAHFAPVSDGRVTIRARSTGGPAYGLVVINRSKLLLQVWRGNQIVDTLKEFQLGNPLQVGQDYEMELRAVGPTLTVRLNGETLGQIEDATHPVGVFQIRGAKGEPTTVRGLEYLDLSSGRSRGRE